MHFKHATLPLIKAELTKTFPPFPWWAGGFYSYMCSVVRVGTVVRVGRPQPLQPAWDELQVVSSPHPYCNLGVGPKKAEGPLGMAYLLAVPRLLQLMERCVGCVNMERWHYPHHHITPLSALQSSLTFSAARARKSSWSESWNSLPHCTTLTSKLAS